MKWKIGMGTCLMIGLMACQSPHNEQSKLTEEGVSFELAQFRKAHFSAVNYQLFFSIPAERQQSVVGEVEIRFQTEQPQPLILDFRAEPEQVRLVELNGQSVAYTVQDEHIVIAKEHVSAGENRVRVQFTPADQSLNRREEFLYTLLVPDRARTLFPCFDQPNLKALFTLTLEVPAAWQAVANGAVDRVDSLSVPGKHLIQFHQTEPLSTYLFSFVAGELQKKQFEREGRTIAIYHRETDPQKVAQCPDIADEVFDALAWQAEFTGLDYPFMKYDLIILPGFQYGGMEHTGATLYADGRMFLDAQPTLNERLGRSALIAHETSHMWFGDYVTMAWFNDVWTKEVFANYFASRIVEPQYPAVNHRLNFIRDYLPSAYSEDRTLGANPIQQSLDNLRNAGLVYGAIIYNKSPIVMEMLVRVLGEEAFREGIQEYIKSFPYGNATWDELIEILDHYTDVDLRSWSQAWVGEKGMPELTATIEGDELVVRQRDSWGRGLVWPQQLAYQLYSHGETQLVELNSDAEEVRVKLEHKDADALILPNIDGRGYGFFRLDEPTAAACWEVLRKSSDEVLRGSLLITLFENLRRQAIDPEGFRASLLAYLPQEPNALLFSMALGYLGNCQALFPADAAPLEEALWQLVTTAEEPSRRLQAFRLYRSIVDSTVGIDRLYTIWEHEQAPEGCYLSESDYISLSYRLAILMPEQADQIVAKQLSRIQNGDRRKEYSFVSPAVSPNKAVRDSVFQALLIAENRRVEPWAASALSLLNDAKREQESIEYIRPAIEILQEVQRTGDIFFPANWMRALLSGHHSKEARDEVDRFFADHPDYSPMLSNKIRQQADHLYLK